MKALVLAEPGRCELEERPKPDVGPGQLLLRMRVHSIGAEHAYSFKGESVYVRQTPRNPYYQGFPLTLEGEVVGEVMEVGHDVQGWQSGDRVVEWGPFQEYWISNAAAALKVPGHLSDEEAVCIPWGGTTLEWQTSSPPITANFEDQPVCDREPYDYRPRTVHA